MKFLLAFALCLISLCARAATPAFSGFYGSGGITVTTNPTAGTVIIGGATGSSSSNAFGLAATNLLWGKTLFLDAVNGRDATALRGDASKPFSTFTGAVAKALSGDTIFARAGIYDAFTNHVKMPHGVNLHGAGMDATFIVGGGAFQTNGCIVNPGSTSSIANLTIIGTNNSVYQGPLGCANSSSDHAFTNVTVYNVRLVAESDCWYVSTNVPCSWRAYSCRAESKWDTFASQGSTAHYFEFIGCSFYVNHNGSTLAANIAANSGTCINHGAGRVELTGCSLESTNAGAINIVNIGAAAAKAYLYGCQWRAAGTNSAFLVDNAAAGTVIMTGMDYLPQDINGTLTGWASQFKQIIYDGFTGTGLKFLNNDPSFPNDPITISILGGFNVGATNDPGADSISANRIALRGNAAILKLWTCTNTATGEGCWSNAVSQVSQLASNFFQMGISNIVAGTNAVIYTNNGTIVVNGTGTGGSGSGGGTNYPPVLRMGTNVTVGSGVRQNLTIQTNASFQVVFTGTPLNGENVIIGVSNISASVIYMTNTAGIFDPTVASNVTTFAIAGTSIKFFDFTCHTNFNLGVARWEVRDAIGKELELAAGNGITFSTNAAVSIITIASIAPYKLFSITNDVIITNQSLVVSCLSNYIGTTTMAANTWQPGMMLDLDLYGKYYNSGSTTLSNQFLLGGITIATNFNPMVAAAGEYVNVKLKVTCRTTGASGIFFAEGTISQPTTAASASGVARVSRIGSLAGTVTIDTTASTVFDYQINPSSTSGATMGYYIHNGSAIITP